MLCGPRVSPRVWLIMLLICIIQFRCSEFDLIKHHWKRKSEKIKLEMNQSRLQIVIWLTPPHSNDQFQLYFSAWHLRFCTLSVLPIYENCCIFSHTKLTVIASRLPYDIKQIQWESAFKWPGIDRSFRSICILRDVHRMRRQVNDSRQNQSGRCYYFLCAVFFSSSLARRHV